MHVVGWRKKNLQRATCVVDKRRERRYSKDNANEKIRNNINVKKLCLHLVSLLNLYWPIVTNYNLEVLETNLN